MSGKDINYEYLYNKIIKDIPIYEDNFVYGVSFIGPPGIGKSTIANIISSKLNMYIASNDEVRRMLDSIGIDASTNQSLVEKLAYDKICYMLKNSTSMIIDANCLTVYKTIEETFDCFNAHCFFIKLECSEKEILRRLDYREKQFGKDNGNFSRATRNDYYNYLDRLKDNIFPKDKIFFTIDTEKNLDIQVDVLINKINEYIKTKNGDWLWK